MSQLSPLTEEEVARINLQRRRNRYMLAAIAFVLLVLMAIFSPGYNFIFLLGSILVAIGMLFVRIYIEKQVQRRRQAHLDDESEGEEGN
jgi:hypothetical protein